MTMRDMGLTKAGRPRRRAPGAGRPANPAGATERVSVRLTHDEVRQLRLLGNGSVSEGVHSLLVSDNNANTVMHNKHAAPMPHTPQTTPRHGARQDDPGTAPLEDEWLPA
jgi:hypothetical protein